MQAVRVPPCSFLSFQVCENLSNSVIACEREEFPSTYLIGEKGGRKGGVKCLVVVLVFFFLFLVRKGVLIFEMASGKCVLEPSICNCWQYSLFLFMDSS